MAVYRLQGVWATAPATKKRHWRKKEDFILISDLVSLIARNDENLPDYVS
jgi:hypothetical protein